MKYPVSKSKCETCSACCLVTKDNACHSLPVTEQYYQCIRGMEEDCKPAGKQIQTERGLVFVSEYYSSEEEARAHGFYYAFSSKQYGNLYSKTLDDKGYIHTFALITEGMVRMEQWQLWELEHIKKWTTETIKDYIWLAMECGRPVPGCISVNALRAELIRRGEEPTGYHNT